MIGRLTVLLLAGLGGCGVIPGLVCTEIGCLSFLTIEVTDLPLADRDMAVTVTLDGEEVPCSAVDEALCELVDGEDGWTALVQLPADTNSVAVRLTVAEGGATVFDDELTPVWGDGVRPNGPGCPPVCYDASAEVVL
jgi:hypothetical protein